MPLHLRNIQTGNVKTVEPDSKEFADLKAERTDDGRFPLWEQTSAGDADPEQFASQYEVDHRSRWGVKPLSDVTTDGVGQSDKAAASDKTQDTDLPTGKPNAKASA
jgi:hypothetical protein